MDFISELKPPTASMDQIYEWIESMNVLYKDLGTCRQHYYQYLDTAVLLSRHYCFVDQTSFFNCLDIVWTWLCCLDGMAVW